MTMVVAMLIGYACTKPTSFGGDLLDDQLADYEFTDTITMNCTLVREDNTLTTSDINTAPYLLCGEILDPVFGKVRADIYTLFAPTTFNPDFNKPNAVLDSAVLYLGYDVNGVYGDSSQIQTIRIFKLAEQIRNDSSYKMTRTLPTAEEVGSISYRPQPTKRDSLTSSTKGPFLRVPLTMAYGEELRLIDSITLTDDSLFLSKIKGLKIVTSANTDPGAILAFDMNDELFSRIRLYYKVLTPTDTTSKTFDFVFNGVRKFNHFEQDYAGTAINNNLNNVNNEWLYLQPLGGVRVKVDFPYAHLLDNIAVNKAELRLITAALPSDNLKLTPANQMVVTQQPNDSTILFVRDVSYSLTPNLNGGFRNFGGDPVKKRLNGQDVSEYRLTLTQFFQGLVDGDGTDLKARSIYLNVYPSTRTAMRSILHGPASTTFPAKLELKYTKVK